ncbi:MAG: sulfotransferase [Myxococcota bacterium]|nr:sulfotransferase [Myxococcota bacterium]
MQRLDEYEKCVDWFEPLHDIAREATGLEDFGDTHYHKGLQVLLEQFDQGCDLSPVGKIATRFKLIHVLTWRLKTEQAFKDDPSIFENPIEKPLVITGLIRTGSTALHYLLASNPNRQALPYWLAEHPQPRPPEAEWEAHPDFQKSKGSIEMMWKMDPSLKSIHFMAPDWPEEGGQLMAHNFTDDHWEGALRVPHYIKWYENTSMVETYRRHKKLLQLIGSSRPGMPWLLKYPVHLKHLKSFLEVYPDARVIWTHRDPSNVMSSYASLLAGFRGINSDNIDRDDIVHEQIDIWSTAAERAIEVRKTMDPGQFYDLHFDDFMADSVGAAEKIYRHFGMDWLPECQAAMEGHRDDNPQGKHGKHAHQQQALGVTREEMLERFAPYINHFNVRT